MENCRCPLNSNVSPIASFKKEWKYHLLINQALFYCSRFAWFCCWFNLSFDCLHLLEHGGVHWLEALLLSTLHTDTQHETWTIPLLIHSLCYSYVLFFYVSIVTFVFKCPVWRTLNFDYQLIFCSMKPTYTDGTEITEKNGSVSQHLWQFLGDKIAKKN